MLLQDRVSKAIRLAFAYPNRILRTDSPVGMHGLPAGMRALALPNNRDRIVAWGISLTLHVALLCFVWSEVGARGSNSSEPGSEGEAAITIDFVAIPREQATPSDSENQAEDADESEDASAAAASAENASSDFVPTPDGDEPALANAEASTSGHDQQEKAEASANSEALAESVTQVAQAAGTQGSAGGTAEDGLEARYRAALVQAIRAQWAGDKERKRGEPCIVTIKQVEGGFVQLASAKGCVLSEEDRRALEAAVVKAQPLPYQGFETVFREERQLAVPTE